MIRWRHGVSISHAAQVLRTESLEAASKQRVYALVERQIRRMARLVDQLLESSSVPDGSWKLEIQRVDLLGVLHNAIESLEHDVASRKHRLRIDLPGSPVWLQADPDRLEQVFVNLLANACRYTDPGGELRVEASVEDGQALVRIRDNGIGIAPDALPYIFDLFNQGKDARCAAGFGIGLAIVRRVVEAHAGTVTVASDGRGRGSVFTVRLPARS